jgi:predicted nuclease with TOPRIM domain
MNKFAPDEIVIIEPVHSLSEEELDRLQQEYNRLKSLVDSGEYELTLEDQKVILQWRRADRETKFILNKIKVKTEKEAKVPKVKKPKKLSQKALGLLYIKELQGEALTEEEERNRVFTLTGEIL